jgi:hypothetical protein
MSLCSLMYRDNNFKLFPKIKRNFKEVVQFLILQKQHENVLKKFLKINHRLTNIKYKKKVLVIIFKFVDNNIKYFYQNELFIKTFKRKIAEFSYDFKDDVFYQNFIMKYSFKCNLNNCDRESDGLYNLCKTCKTKKYTMEKKVGNTIDNFINIGCGGIKLIIFDYMWKPSYPKNEK